MEDYEESFIHEFGPLFKSLGQGDTAGKIIGLLMIGKDREYTLDMISELIGRSKSTVHSAMKQLLELGIVEQGVDDKSPSEGRYAHLYHFKDDFWELRLKKMEAITIFKDLIGHSIRLIRERDPDDPRLVNFEKMYSLYAFFEEELPKLLNVWEEQVETGDYRAYLSDID